MFDLELSPLVTDTLSISNLYVEKLIEDVGPVELLIQNSELPKTNLTNDMALEVIEYTEPYLECTWLPINQYAYDNDEDRIKVDLLYENNITSWK